MLQPSTYPVTKDKRDGAKYQRVAETKSKPEEEHKNKNRKSMYGSKQLKLGLEAVAKSSIEKEFEELGIGLELEEMIKWAHEGALGNEEELEEEAARRNQLKLSQSLR